MKNSILLTLLLCGAAWGQDASKSFHHCNLVNGSGNTPHLFDVSEIYKCDEGNIEISGTWNETIERGYIFMSELGRPSRQEPRKATEADYKGSKWCATPKPWDAGQKERCGDVPIKCWNGKMATWDKDWRGYSCVTKEGSPQ